MINVYRLRGMHCDGCATKIERGLRDVPGVRHVSVSFQNKEAKVDADATVAPEQLDAAVRLVGDYELDVVGKSPDDTTPLAAATQSENRTEESLYPLLLILGFILGVTILIGIAQHSWAIEPMMRHFMAGFFLVFSFFKLLDLPGFVSAYRGYDLVAKKVNMWAWSYPFVELALGIAYVLAVAPVATNLITFVLMLIGSIGVLNALVNKQAIRCACLGTALNLPMTKVTLVEDLTMAGMAAIMLTLAWT